MLSLIDGAARVELSSKGSTPDRGALLHTGVTDLDRLQLDALLGFEHFEDLGVFLGISRDLTVSDNLARHRVHVGTCHRDGLDGLGCHGALGHIDHGAVVVEPDVFELGAGVVVARDSQSLKRLAHEGSVEFLF